MFDARPLRDGGEQLRVSPQVERGGIHDGIDAFGLGPPQRGDGRGFPIWAEQVRIAAEQPARAHHHMLVHQREAKLFRRNRAEHGVNLRHGEIPSRTLEADAAPHSGTVAERPFAGVAKRHDSAPCGVRAAATVVG